MSSVSKQGTSAGELVCAPGNGDHRLNRVTRGQDCQDLSAGRSSGCSSDIFHGMASDGPGLAVRLKAEGAVETAHACRPDPDVVEQSPLTIAPAVNGDWLVGVIGRAEAVGVAGQGDSPTGGVTVPRESFATGVGRDVGIRPARALEGHVERADCSSGGCCGADGRDNSGHEPDECGLGDAPGHMNRRSVGEARSYHETIPSYLGPRRVDDLRGTACAIMRQLSTVRNRHS
jgi:hypothetical protein